MATDNILHDIIARQRNITRGLGNPTGNMDAAQLIADIVGRRRDISETLANQNRNIGFANARQFADAAEETAQNRFRGAPVGNSTGPLSDAIREAEESRAAVEGSGWHIPGQGLIAAALQPVKNLAEVGLKSGAWGLEQIGRVDDAVKAGVFGTVHAMNTDKQSFGEALDDFFLNAGRNFVKPGSVEVGGGAIYNELHDLVPGWEGATNFFDKLIPGTPGDVKWGSPSSWPTLLHPERFRDVALSATFDVGLSPSSYVSLGATSALKPGSKAAIDAVAKANLDELAQLTHVPAAGRNALKEVATRKGMRIIEDIQDDVRSGIRRGTRKVSPKLVDAKVTQEAGRVIEEVVKDGEQWAAKHRKWLNAGQKGPKPVKNPAYEAVYNAAKTEVDNMISNAGTIVHPSQVTKWWDEALRTGFSNYANQFTDDVTNAIRKTWDPMLRRKINPRLGFLGRGADLGEGRLAQALPESVTSWLDPVLEAAYKPLGKTSELGRRFKIGKDVLRTFSTEEHIPGFASKIRQQTKASGVREFENMMFGKHGPMPSFVRYGTNAAGKTQAMANVVLKPMREIFKGIDDDLAREIYDAIEDGRVMTGTSPGGIPYAQIQQDVKDWFEYFGKQRLDTGMSIPQEMVDDFLPAVHKRAWRKEAREQAKAFKDARKLEAHGGTNQIVKYNATNGANMFPALKFQRDIRTALSEYAAKHQRDMLRLNWQTEMINRFGVSSAKLAPSVRDALGLVKVPTKHIPRAMRTNASGLTHYMSKELLDVMDSWENLFSRSASGLEEVQSISNFMEQANRAWKISATVMRPSFQLRNFLGDVSTGWLDMVPGHKFGRWAKASAQGPATTVFEEAGRKYSVQYLEDEFMRRAGSSSFFNTGQLERKSGEGLINSFVNFNEARENLPRKVHYSTAFEDEMRARAKLYRREHGGKNPIGRQLKEMEEKAHQAATTRVNKFKFDYSNLTPIEAQIFKNLIPFYTFQKKATQMVLENALLSPSRMNAFNRVMAAVQGNLSGDPNEEWLHMNQVSIPDYARDMGFMPLQPLGDSGDIFGLNPSILPQYALNQNLAGDETQDIWRNFGGQLNPILRFPFEMATGQDIGTGLPRGSSPEDLTSYLPPLGVIGKGLNLIGAEPAGRWLAGDASTKKGNMMTFADLVGLPVQNITEEQRTYAAKDYGDPYGTTVSKINKNLESKGVEVKTITKTVDGQKTKVYRVQSAEVDPETGRHTVYQEFGDRAGAYAFAVKAAS